MKKVVSLILFLTAAFALNAEVIWTGEAHNVGSWDSKQFDPNEYPLFATASAGDIIVITVTNVEDGAAILPQFRTSPGWTDWQYIALTQTGRYSFVLTSEQAELLKTVGLAVNGQNFSFNKAELLYQKPLWIGRLNDNGGWKQSSVVPGKLFAGLSENSIIGVQISNINNGATWHQYALRADWRTDIVISSISETKIYLHTLSAADADSLRNKNMIIIAQYLNVTALYSYVDELPAADSKVYFVNNKGWNNVNCYAWDGEGSNASWPGTAMTNTERTLNGNVIWEINGLSSYTNCIFNNGTNQTADLSLYPGMMYYENISGSDSLCGWVAFATDNIMLAGGMNGWVGEWMADADDFKSCSITKTMEPGIYEFKLIRDNSWLGNSGTMTRVNCAGWTFESYDNCKIKVDVPGDYVFTYNYAGKALSVAYPASFVRSAENTNYQSLCVPFDATISNATAYSVSAVSDEVITINPTENLLAGKSYVIKPEAAGDMVISYVENGNIVGTSDGHNDYMYGILGDPFTIPASLGAYILSGNQFHRVDADDIVTVTSTRAYLKMENAGGAPAALRIIEAENGATAMENLEATEVAVKFVENGKLYILREGVVYDMTGKVVR